MSTKNRHTDKESLPGGGHFHTPEGYFDALENRIDELISVQDLPHGGSFDVPAKYFEDIETKVLRLTGQAKQEGRSLRMWLPFIAAAAGLAIFLVVYFQGREKCESFTCLLEKSDITSEDLLFIEEETIAEYYLEHASLSDMSPEMQDELIESLLEEGFDEDMLEAIPLD